MAVPRSYCSIAHGVFIDNYDRLTSLNLSILDSCLVSKNIITPACQENITAAKTNCEKSTLILQVIAFHLESDFTESLHIMFEFMIERGDMAMQQLAKEMKSQLSEGKLANYLAN